MALTSCLDYNAELEADVKGDTSGGFQDLLLSILGGDRDAGSSVNQEEAKEDAKALYQVQTENSGLVWLIPLADAINALKMNNSPHFVTETFHRQNSF